MNQAMSIAQGYAQAGLCVLPVRADGSKAPALDTWTEWEHKRPTSKELAAWFAHCEGFGLACGSASGGLEVLDFDDGALYPLWRDQVEAEIPGLLDRLPVDESPSGGRHIFWRCAQPEGNLKLARKVGKDGKPETLIETRGQGGFIVVPPTSGRYHPSGKPYRMVRGDLAAIPTITAGARAVLLDLARSFNKYVPIVSKGPDAARPNAGNRPGDLWAASTSWAEILEPHGWKGLRQRGDVTYWQRPGKDGPGCSATTGHGGHDVLFVFSSNAAPFESDQGYSKFTAYTLLSHAGDFSEATKALVGMGFGSPPIVAEIPEEPEWLRDAPPGEDLAGTEPLTKGDTTTGYTPAVGEHPIAQVSTWLDTGKVLGPIVWAWPHWLPCGFLTILAGATGKGKSSLALRIAGCYLAGWPWPDGSVFTGEQGSVLWCETEGAQALNLERAGKWGLPVERILNPLVDPLAEVSLDNPQHKQAIEAAARLPGVRLIVVDSLSAALGPGRDENDSRVLSVLKWLATLARDSGKPVKVTHHLRKRGQVDTSDEVNLERVRGSSAIVQVARLVWGLDSPDPTKPETLRLQVLKSNLDRFPPAIGLSIDEEGVHFTEAPERPHKPSRLEVAKGFLQDLLEHGLVTASEGEQKAANADLSEPTVRRARTALGIESDKVGDVYYWHVRGEHDELMKAIRQIQALSSRDSLTS